jgi:hypothetical protein
LEGRRKKKEEEEEGRIEVMYVEYIIPLSI